MFHNPACTGCKYCENPFKPRDPRSVPLQKRTRRSPTKAPSFAASFPAPEGLVDLVEKLLTRKVRLFSAGRVSVTPEAYSQSSRSFKNECLDKHESGQFGIISAWQLNENAISLETLSGPVISAFVAPNKNILVISTRLEIGETRMFSGEVILQRAPHALDLSRIPK